MVSIINICCALFLLKGRFLFLKCLVKVFINKFYFIAGLKNEEKLVTWTTKSTKLLISLRRQKADLLDKGKVRKKVAWDKVAELLTMSMHRDTLNIETIRYLTAGSQGPIQSELSVFLLQWATGQMHFPSEYAHLVLTIEQVVQMSRMTSGNGSCSHRNDSEEQ